MTKINVARLVKPGQPLESGTADMPAPGPKDVRVRVAACGLVPNTYNIVNGRTPFILQDLPAVFGLDVAGTIDAVGEHVLHLKVGDRVYVDPFLTCETCHHCRRGRRDLCAYHCLRGYCAWSPEAVPLLNSYPLGGMSEYILSPHNKVALLPESIDLLTAARFGYIGTTFGALAKGGFGPGQTLLINGITGTLGVAAVAIALGMGANRILGTGRNKELLKQVRQMAPDLVDVRSPDDSDVVSWVRSQTGGYGVDLLYDCLGVGGDTASTNMLITAVKDGGKAVLVAGGAMGDVGRPYFEHLMHDVQIMGSQWFTDIDLERMIAMIASGAIDMSYLNHRQFSLSEVNDAINFIGSRPGGFTNVVVIPGQSGQAASL